MEKLEQIFDLIQIQNLSDGYVSSSLTSAIIVGIIACALIIFTAIASKKALGLGITAGIFAIIGSVANHFAVVYFHTTTFVITAKFVGSSQGEVDQMVEDFTETYMTENLPKMLLYSLASALVFAAWVVILIFIMKAMKIKPKAAGLTCGIVALLLHIGKFLFIGPVNIFSPILNNTSATEAMQKSQDSLVYAMTLIPLFLVAVAGLVSLIVRCVKKGAPEAVAEAAAPVDEAEAVEAPAEEAVEAPAEEATVSAEEKND